VTVSGSRPFINRFSPRARIRLLQVAGVVAFFTLWQVFGARRVEWYSQPSRMVSDLLDIFGREKVLPYIEGNFWELTGKSLGALFVGMAISFAIGVTVGFIIGRYRLFQVAFDPYMAAFYSVPRVAFVPIMVIWFGISANFEAFGFGIPLSKFVIASVVVSSAVLIAFSTAVGVRETMREYDEVSLAFNLQKSKAKNEEWIVAVVFGVVFIGIALGFFSLVIALGLVIVAVGTLVARDRHLFLKILLPGSVPFIATGLRLSVQRSLVAVIVAEFLIGVPGLGFVIRDARAGELADRLYAMALFLMVLGVLIIVSTKIIEARLSAWRPKVFNQ
jgi:ABC-type nitrate/sulfonate/bicarbonate transport system permease component